MDLPIGQADRETPARGIEGKGDGTRRQPQQAPDVSPIVLEVEDLREEARHDKEADGGRRSVLVGARSMVLGDGRQ